jgi:hypothetical protein
MAAITRIGYASGAGPTFSNAETGIVYNREETLAGATNPVVKLNATGTAFSWPKVLCLEVTTADTTSISNRRHHIASAPATGLRLWFRNDGNTYTRATANAAVDSGTNDSTPAGYTAAPTTATSYDATSVTAATGRNGSYLSYAFGVSNLYLGGASTGVSLPSLTLTYDEL